MTYKRPVSMFWGVKPGFLGLCHIAYVTMPSRTVCGISTHEVGALRNDPGGDTPRCTPCAEALKEVEKWGEVFFYDYSGTRRADNSAG